MLFFNNKQARDLKGLDTPFAHLETMKTLYYVGGTLARTLAILLAILIFDGHYTVSNRGTIHDICTWLVFGFFAAVLGSIFDRIYDRHFWWKLEKGYLAVGFYLHSLMAAVMAGYILLFG